MKVLIACEESQTVCNEFRKLGHEAYSNDIKDTYGDNPEWHIKGNVLDILNDNWDIIIAFPPCTYLCASGNRWFDIDKYGKKAEDRHLKREEAVSFIKQIYNSNCKHIAIENPIGTLSTRFRKPDQIIHPYQFGDPHKKTTCLWLKRLPKLEYTDIVKPEEDITLSSGKRISKWYNIGECKARNSLRSKTFEGIAKAMAIQWSKFWTEKYIMT